MEPHYVSVTVCIVVDAVCVAAASAGEDAARVEAGENQRGRQRTRAQRLHGHKSAV